MGYIYKIYNDINNKVYIGQTIRTIEVRWKQHLMDCDNANKQRHLYNAMKKYGKEHFFIEVIEEIDNNILNEREKYWIDYYDSYNNGYNSTLGGAGIPIYNIDINILYDLWDKGFSIGEISRELEVPRKVITTHIMSYKNYSIEESNRRGRLQASKSKSKKVYQWDYLGETIINIFQSGVEAEEKTGISRKDISKAINSHTRAGNFLWTFTEEKPIIPKGNAKIIYQYDLQNNFIRKWDSAAQVKRELGYDDSSIRKCVRGEKEKYKNFIWRGEKSI